MDKPLIINGSENLRSPFSLESPFYPGCSFQVADATQMDIAHAIGSARSADRSSLPARAEALRRAAAAFDYTSKDLEHAVQMTGMPIRLVESLIQQIPKIFREVSRIQEKRFSLTSGENPHHLESLGEGRFKILQKLDGFCYAVAPGNDPRASALVAANLAYWGIPFVLRASPRDAAAPLTIRALLQGGFEPKFCSLVYLDPASSETQEKHFKLVAASSVVWTFGPAGAIDPTLRFEGQRRVVLDLDGVAGGSEIDLETLRSILEEGGMEETLSRLKLVEERRDHFEGKTIVRHEAGNCAALAWGELDGRTRDTLYQSIGFTTICTAVKSLFAVDSAVFIQQLAEFFPSLKTGDPLDPETQVGYLQPRHLDRLEALVQANRRKAIFYGGKRLSPIQAEPLLVAARTDLPDFFGQEIPAYILAVGECQDFEQATAWLNRHQDPPRLVVTLLNSPKEVRLKALKTLRCHALLLDTPTSILVPALHEGNDYGLTLTQGRLLVI
jgi:acyl-CoA reductase-like NAD-dependent aldehyde dehydrogenase